MSNQSSRSDAPMRAPADWPPQARDVWVTRDGDNVFVASPLGGVVGQPVALVPLMQFAQCEVRAQSLSPVLVARQHPDLWLAARPGADGGEQR